MEAETMEQWVELDGFAYPVRVDRAGRVERHTRGGWNLARPLMKGGDVMVTLRPADGNGRKYTVSRLVAEAFLGGLRPPESVLHINGDRTDNRLENLEIVTRAELLRSRGITRTGNARAVTKPVVKVDPEGRVLAWYPSCTVAAQENSLSLSSLTSECRGERQRPQPGKCRYRFALPGEEPGS